MRPGNSPKIEYLRFDINFVFGNLHIQLTHEYGKLIIAKQIYSEKRSAAVCDRHLAPNSHPEL
jgi:hypothetical protein